MTNPLFDEAAPIGHNRPPPDAFDKCKRRADELQAAGDRWLKDKGEIADLEAAEKAATFVKQCRMHEQKAADELKDEATPAAALLAKIRDRWKDLIDPIAECREAVNAALTEYMDGQKLRSLKTDLGQTATLMEGEEYEIDRHHLDLKTLLPYLSDKMLTTAIAQHRKDKREKIAGVRVIKTRKAVVR